MTKTLLIEIFTEELPPKSLSQLGAAFADEFFKRLRSHGLTSSETSPKFYATPRRLAVSIPNVLTKAADKPARVKVLPVNVALDAQGNPSAALSKKLASLGFPQLSVADLERAVDGKAESFFYSYTAPGIDLVTALQTALPEAVAALPIPKVMHYQTEAGVDVQFVRPAHGLIALYGNEVIPVNVLGLSADRITHGHRFQGAADITLDNADEYNSKLAKEGGVIADFSERLEEIRRQLQQHATKIGAHLRLEERESLLAEVTALVENPTVYLGEFESAFLEVPQECLILTMQQNQKYFPLFDQTGKLLNKFLIVSNMRLDDPKNIVEGNQRVIRPRLADARFFFEQDKKLPLADRIAQLAHVVYHNKLGSQLDRIGRLQRLASAIAEKLGVNPALADRAALLCKADLVTNMVGEFPELQGIMGRYYATHDGEDPQVAEAIEAHYRPRFAGDVLPSSGIATAVALADKLSTLTAIFGIGQAPTGDKDPFALRRAALGLLRILIEQRLTVDLHALINIAFEIQPSAIKEAPADLQAFIYERLRGFLREQGYTALEVESVLYNQPTKLDQLPAQLAAVRAFMELPEAQSLVAANKRVANILKKSEESGEAFAKADAKQLQEPAEHALYESLQTITPRAAELLANGDYTGYLKSFAGLKAPVDAFFDSVMVMVEDNALRSNRIALLNDLRHAMNRVADISKLAA